LTDGGAPYVERFFPALRDALELLFTFPRPVIAAANGHAVAGGCLIVAACDYRLMSGGKIGVPELQVGVPLPAIAAEILQFAAGRHAQWLAYTGVTIAPEEACGRGLIDEVVAPDFLMARATEIAQKLAAAPADAFRITKLQFRRRADLDRQALAVWSRPDVHAHIREYLALTVRKR
jgi:enoyl-CoA hydratase